MAVRREAMNWEKNDLPEGHGAHDFLLMAHQDNLRFAKGGSYVE